MTSWQSLFDQAAQAHREGRLAEAEPLYRRLFDHGVAAGRVANLLGVLCFQAGRPTEAVRWLEQGLAIDPGDQDAYGNFALVLTKLGQIDRAIAVLEQGLARFPSQVALHSQMGWLCIVTKNYTAAVRHNLVVVNANRLAYKAHGNLTTAYWSLGDTERALAHGRLALAAKDEVCCRNAGAAAPPPRYVRSEESVQPLERLGPATSRQMLAYSLWGDKRTYTEGAIANAELAARFYPGWGCRFYCARSVPEPVRERLLALGAQVFVMPGGERGFEGAFWRFFIADDPEVERFACRDCDSRPTHREQAAVAEWVASQRAFHILRDALVHCDLILAGLWGGVTGRLPSLQTLFRTLPVIDDKFADQDFLAQHIWPVIKHDTCTHDTFYTYPNGQPFPAGTDLPGNLHVGVGHILPDPPAPSGA